MTSPTLPEARPHSPILLADPRVRAIAVRDNGEPLVDLPAWLTAATGSAARSRRGVAIRLRAAALLLPADLRLRVVEGYRCAADQLAIEAAYRLVVSKEHPSADTAEIERLTSRFVAPLEVAGHVAGHGHASRTWTRTTAVPGLGRGTRVPSIGVPSMRSSVPHAPVASPWARRTTSIS